MRRLVGAQGWLLPHLSRNSDVAIAAIVEPASTIRSTLNPDMDQLDALKNRYNAPVFETFSAMLTACVEVDSVLVAAPHNEVL